MREGKRERDEENSRKESDELLPPAKGWRYFLQEKQAKI
jgi:hypothetical protein